jgi:hypothetical protein
MQIICTKRLHFQEHEIVKNEKTDENVAIVKRSIIVAPSIHPQTVPDWIKNDDLFGLSEDDETIKVVNVLSTPKTKGNVKSPANLPVEEKREDEKPSGWGAKPGAGLPNGNDLGGKLA